MRDVIKISLSIDYLGHRLEFQLKTFSKLSLLHCDTRLWWKTWAFPSIFPSSHKFSFPSHKIVLIQSVIADLSITFHIHLCKDLALHCTFALFRTSALSQSLHHLIFFTCSLTKFNRQTEVCLRFVAEFIVVSNRFQSVLIDQKKIVLLIISFACVYSKSHARVSEKHFYFSW